MQKKNITHITRTIFCLLVCVLLLSVPVGKIHADVQPANGTEEAIISFQSVVQVNTDNSINVREAIEYTTGPQSRHGIYRDIYPYSSTGRLMNITDISVVDGSGNPYEWVRQTYGNYVRIRIGDPNATFTGNKVYILSYKASDAIAHLKNLDEIYWNATGDDWQIPIYQSQAVLYLPTGVKATQYACYYGVMGSPSKCGRMPFDTYSFASPRALSPGEGLTVAVGFPAGIIPPYTVADDLSALLIQYFYWIVGAIITLIFTIFMFIRWWKIGRDPKDAAVIIPEYDVPDQLTPFEVSCILNQKIRNTDISAEIVYLATKGYIKIKYIHTKVIGIFDSTDYELELLKSYADLPNEFDRILLDGIFYLTTSPGSTVKLSNLKNKFYKNIPKISDAVVDAMLNKGYYGNLKKHPFLSSNNTGIISSFFVTVYLIIFVSLFASAVTQSGGTPFVVFSIILMSIALLFNHIMPAKTQKGVDTKDYILGLKWYLQIAEKDRLAFHNAPEKKPEIFEALLPYAMVLGVDRAWAKEFEDIYTTPPSWYEGYPVTSGVFNVVAFNQSLSSFGAATTTSMATSPGGGSGGGGFAGGGGGGGGGGGW